MFKKYLSKKVLLQLTLCLGLLVVAVNAQAYDEYFTITSGSRLVSSDGANIFLRPSATDVTLGAIAISGDSEFSIDSAYTNSVDCSSVEWAWASCVAPQCSTGATIASGSSCWVHVTYARTSSSAATNSASLTFSDSAGTSLATESLRGEGSSETAGDVSDSTTDETSTSSGSSSSGSASETTTVDESATDTSTKSGSVTSDGTSNEDNADIYLDSSGSSGSSSTSGKNKPSGGPKWQPPKPKGNKFSHPKLGK